MIDEVVDNVGAVLEKAQSVAKYAKMRKAFKWIKMECNKNAIDACFNKQYSSAYQGYFPLPKM